MKGSNLICKVKKVFKNYQKLDLRDDENYVSSLSPMLCPNLLAASNINKKIELISVVSDPSVVP